MQYPRTLKNNIYLSNKRVPPPFFHSDANPVFGHVLIHFFWQNPCSCCNSGIDLVVALKYTLNNAKQISFRLARFRRSYVKCPAVALTSHTSNIVFLIDVRCAVHSDHIPFFCVCLSPIIVYLRNLFLFCTPRVWMLLIPMWVSRQKDEKMWNSYPLINQN